MLTTSGFDPATSIPFEDVLQVDETVTALQPLYLTISAMIGCRYGLSEVWPSLHSTVLKYPIHVEFPPTPFWSRQRRSVDTVPESESL